ncbi:MAG: carboxypeptidase regulatory-like domain-containing protein [Gemmatimonadetes bacterium]|nr:carboxypeptidase regulatory-like domain-containing protein [Gemmatimonadota bacterium]
MRLSPRLVVIVVGIVAVAVASPLNAQVIRGTLRSQTSARAIERARVTAQARDGRVIGEVLANDSGAFTLRVAANGAPFTLTVRRIGIEPSTTSELLLAATDTVEFELTLPETPVLGDTVRVTGRPSINEERYQEAKRHGWTVFSPAEVEKHRERVNNVYDLLRWAGANSLVIPTRHTECVRSARYLPGDRRNDRCMVWVVDGQVLGPLPVLNPRDTYFMAVLTASQSLMQYGEKAPWGAIVLYTRMNGDQIHK